MAFLAILPYIATAMSAAGAIKAGNAERAAEFSEGTADLVHGSDRSFFHAAKAGGKRRVI